MRHAFDGPAIMALLVAAAFISPSWAAGSHACATYVANPDQWIESSASGILKCYGLLADSMVDKTFTSTCEHNCHYEGCQVSSTSYCSTAAKPIRIRSQAENDAVKGLFSFIATTDQGKGLSIGVRKQSSHATSFPNEWRLTGTGGDKRAPFTPWAAGEPKADGNNAVMTSDGLWVAKTSKESGQAACGCEIQIGTHPPFPPAPPPPVPVGEISGAAVGALALLGAVCVAVRVRAQRRVSAAKKAAPPTPRETHEVTQPDGGIAVTVAPGVKA